MDKRTKYLRTKPDFYFYVIIDLVSGNVYTEERHRKDVPYIYVRERGEIALKIPDNVHGNFFDEFLKSKVVLDFLNTAQTCSLEDMQLDFEKLVEEYVPYMTTPVF